MESSCSSSAVEGKLEEVSQVVEKLHPKRKKQILLALISWWGIQNGALPRHGDCTSEDSVSTSLYVQLVSFFGFITPNPGHAVFPPKLTGKGVKIVRTCMTTSKDNRPGKGPGEHPSTPLGETRLTLLYTIHKFLLANDCDVLHTRMV